jgi:hypothetical protein
VMVLMHLLTKLGTKLRASGFRRRPLSSYRPDANGQARH